MNNLADLCRECELPSQTRELEQAGDRIVKLVNEIYAMMGGPCLLQDAVKEWEKVKGGIRMNSSDIAEIIKTVIWACFWAFVVWRTF